MTPSPEIRRQELYDLMGDLPDRDRPIQCDKVGEEDRGAYILEKLVLDLNGVEPVPAFFTRTLCHDDEGEAFAVLFPFLDAGSNRPVIKGDLRDQDHIRTTR